MQATDGDIDAFLEHAEIYGEGEGDGEITYIFSSTDYYAAVDEELGYLDEIAEKLENMAKNAISVVKSSYGYHIICKYDLVEGAYDDEKHENDFADFYVNLIALLFDGDCEKYKKDVTINQDILAGALTINEIGVNTLY